MKFNLKGRKTRHRNFDLRMTTEGDLPEGSKILIPEKCRRSHLQCKLGLVKFLSLL